MALIQRVPRDVAYTVDLIVKFVFEGYTKNSLIRINMYSKSNSGFRKKYIKSGKITFIEIAMYFTKLDIL